jgi:rod shape determining protein RodA
MQSHSNNRNESVCVKRTANGNKKLQSKISIGSGGFLGKGLGAGTQSQLDFLPEHQTDFIFASMSEDFGFIVGLILLILYSLIIYISIGISINSKSVFGKLLVIGVIAMFFSHIFINIGMVMGLVPVVGVPLPFISYGGTMMGSMLGGFALIMNVHINQSAIITKK